MTQGDWVSNLTRKEELESSYPRHARQPLDNEWPALTAAASMLLRWNPQLETETLLSMPLAAFSITITVPQPIQVSPVMPKLLESVVRAVKFDAEHLIEVLVTACSCIGLCKMGSDLVRVTAGGSMSIVGPAAVLMR